MRTKKEIITEVIERVRDEVPVSEEIRQDITLVRSGISYKGLCPFHNDRKIGSFLVTDGKKLFKCFSCGTGGDVIKYVSLRSGDTYTKAGLDLALKYGKMSYDEYNYCIGNGISNKLNANIERIYIEKDKEMFKSLKADIETLDKVYSLFKKGFTYLHKTKLSPEHKRQLLEERHLTEEEIEEKGYFTFPTRYIMKHLLNDLDENDISADVLRTIPGFFFDKKKDTWSFMTVTGGGIGIPITDENGKIQAIQIRRDVIKEGDSRYIWFSSSFAQIKEDLDYGVSSGSPINVVIPNVIKTQTIFITEGHFKAMKIAKEFGSIALSVQGVGAWALTVKKIEELKEIYPNLNLKYTYIAYDGDMSFNLGVFQQAINMGVKLHGLNHHDKSEEILKSLSNEALNAKNIVYYCMWDEDLGKGIDDLLFNNNGHKLDKIKLTDLYSLHQTYMNTLKEAFVDEGIYDNIDKIEQKEKKEYFERIILSTLPKYKNI